MWLIVMKRPIKKVFDLVKLCLHHNMERDFYIRSIFQYCDRDHNRERNCILNPQCVRTWPVSTIWVASSHLTFYVHICTCFIIMFLYHNNGKPPWNHKGIELAMQLE